MAQTWPVGLPQVPLMQGFSRATPSKAITFVPASGKIRTRQRSTGAQRSFSISMVLTKAQVAIFDMFFSTTIKGGVLSISFTDPADDASIEFLIIGNPAMSPLSGTHWQLNFKAERTA